MNTMNLRLIIFNSALACLLLPCAQGAELRVDLASPNSLILEDFNVTSDTSSELRKGVSFVSAAAGIATYRIDATNMDP